MLFECLFNLFGINLLSRRIDADRAAPKQGEGAIASHNAPVTGYGIALSINGFECLSRFLRILVISQWHCPAARYKTRLIRARFNFTAIL